MNVVGRGSTALLIACMIGKNGGQCCEEPQWMGSRNGGNSRHKIAQLKVKPERNRCNTSKKFQ